MRTTRTPPPVRRTILLLAPRAFGRGYPAPLFLGRPEEKSRAAARLFLSSLRASDLSEAAGLKVGQRLVDFLAGVHHEGTVARDGFAQWLACKHERAGAALCCTQL